MRAEAELPEVEGRMTTAIRNLRNLCDRIDGHAGQLRRIADQVLGFDQPAPPCAGNTAIVTLQPPIADQIDDLINEINLVCSRAEAAAHRLSALP